MLVLLHVLVAKWLRRVMYDVYTVTDGRGVTLRG